MKFKYLNHLEILNYINLLIFTYFLFLFTELVPDIEVRYKLGYAFIFLLIIVIGLNLMLISRSMYVDSVHQYKKDKAKKAWDAYNQLKIKMVDFIID